MSWFASKSLPVIESQRTKVDELAHSYRAAFSSRSGQAVLDDFVARGFGDVVLVILRMLRKAEEAKTEELSE